MEDSQDPRRTSLVDSPFLPTVLLLVCVSLVAILVYVPLAPCKPCDGRGGNTVSSMSRPPVCPFCKGTGRIPLWQSWRDNGATTP